MEEDVKAALGLDCATYTAYREVRVMTKKGAGKFLKFFLIDDKEREVLAATAEDQGDAHYQYKNAKGFNQHGDRKPASLEIIDEIEVERKDVDGSMEESAEETPGEHDVSRQECPSNEIMGWEGTDSGSSIDGSQALEVPDSPEPGEQVAWSNSPTRVRILWTGQTQMARVSFSHFGVEVRQCASISIALCRIWSTWIKRASS
eukprot:evm.model.scf_604.2 EVM.evm.TU.scf_604.2   scf_604:16615-27537(-)